MSSVVGHNDHLVVFVDDLSVSMRIFAVFVLKLTEVLGHRDSHRLASRIIALGGDEIECGVVSTVEWVFPFGGLLAFVLAFFDFFDFDFKLRSKIINNVACLACNRSAVGSLFDVMPSAEEQV